MGANFAVGAIFGVWKGCGFLHRTGSQQVAAAYAVYGPRTSLVIALPATGMSLPTRKYCKEEGIAKDLNWCFWLTAGSSARTVREYTLAGRSNETWKLSRENIRIGEKKVECISPTLQHCAQMSNIKSAAEAACTNLNILLVRSNRYLHQRTCELQQTTQRT